VHEGSRLLAPESGELKGGRDEAHHERVAVDRDDGERHTIDADRTLLHHIPAEPWRERDAYVVPTLAWLADRDLADSVNVALHDVAAEPARWGGRALQVDALADRQRSQRRAVDHLLHDIGGEGVAVHIGHCQADAIDGDGV